MDILFLLIPLSVVLVFAIIGVFAWALRSGQFDDIEREGMRILQGDALPQPDRTSRSVASRHQPARVDTDQVSP
jgi:cbb3-type cytochrome oxidase maturation protein